MKTLKRFSSVLVLSSVLGVAALTGEVNTPPCAAPGEIQTPPGEAGSSSVVPGEMSGPLLSEAMIADVWAALDLVF
jgi:hypothetical protein